MRFSSLSFFNFIFIRALSSNSRDDDDTPVGLGGGAASSSLEESNLELCFAGIATGLLLILNPPIGGFGVTIGGLATTTGGLAAGACIPVGLTAAGGGVGLAGTTEFALGVVAPPAFAPPVAIFARCASGTSSSSLESSSLGLPFAVPTGFPAETGGPVVVVVVVVVGRCADGAPDPSSPVVIGRSCARDGGLLATPTAAARCARGTSSSSLELLSVGIVVVVVARRGLPRRRRRPKRTFKA
jgi:hypothetical protein